MGMASCRIRRPDEYNFKFVFKIKKLSIGDTDLVEVEIPTVQFYLNTIYTTNLSDRYGLLYERKLCGRGTFSLQEQYPNWLACSRRHSNLDSTGLQVLSASHSHGLLCATKNRLLPIYLCAGEDLNLHALRH